jgi:glyceraldehyde 3-phosphate dehydrogenase
MSFTRIGLMGFGRVGRQLYLLALEDQRFQVTAIADIGRPEILHHLLTRSTGPARDIRLDKHYLVSGRGRARMLSADRPEEIPWDVFGTDLVIDATGRYRSRGQLAPHIENGARRVILSVLPEDDLDRVVLHGVNDASADPADRIVSAGSASTTATALALKTISEAWEIRQATMTSVHAYTSDQSLQDYAGPDYRRSRSGAENIIPNDTPAVHWVEQTLPALAGRLSGYALNVPVPVGSLLDLTVSLAQADVTAEAVNERFVSAAKQRPDLIGTVADPIVSSDVRGRSESLLVDLMGTMKSGASMIKLLAWHESLGHARRILDLAAGYAELDAEAEREAS